MFKLEKEQKQTKKQTLLKKITAILPALALVSIFGVTSRICTRSIYNSSNNSDNCF